MNTPSDAGSSSPLGSTVCDGGVNFSVYSRSASGIDLLTTRAHDGRVDLPAGGVAVIRES